jgi:hypothetical protein
MTNKKRREDEPTDQDLISDEVKEPEPEPKPEPDPGRQNTETGPST